MLLLMDQVMLSSCVFSSVDSMVTSRPNPAVAPATSSGRPSFTCPDNVCSPVNTRQRVFTNQHQTTCVHQSAPDNVCSPVNLAVSLLSPVLCQPAVFRRIPEQRVDSSPGRRHRQRRDTKGVQGLVYNNNNNDNNNNDKKNNNKIIIMKYLLIRREPLVYTRAGQAA